MKIKSLLICLMAAFMLPSCSSPKLPKGEKEVFTPCTGDDYESNKKFFRANAMGFSANQNLAVQKATTAARSSLAALIDVTIKTVTDSYLSSYEENQREEARGRFQTVTREVVNQKLNGVKVICKQVTKTKDGQYRCYVAVELASDEVVAGINSGVSSESKLRTDYEYEKFKGVFEGEMSKLEK